MKNLGFWLTQLIFICCSYAQSPQTSIKGIEAFITEQTRIVNSSNLQSNQILRKALKGEQFSIPRDWRLVSVVPDVNKSNGNTEYLLFFQDSKSAVHSLGIQSNGFVSGGNFTLIPASE